jgi:hypothetical protein
METAHERPPQVRCAPLRRPPPRTDQALDVREAGCRTYRAPRRRSLAGGRGRRNARACHDPATPVRENLAHLADRTTRPRAGRREFLSKSSIHSREPLALPIDAQMKDLAARNLRWTGGSSDRCCPRGPRPARQAIHKQSWQGVWPARRQRLPNADFAPRREPRRLRFPELWSALQRNHRRNLRDTLTRDG